MRLACLAAALLRAPGPGSPRQAPVPIVRAHQDAAADADAELGSTAVECGGRTVRFPNSMMLIGGKALWCPNAKVATTTIWSLLSGSDSMTEQKAHGRCSARYGCSPEWRARGVESLPQVPAARHGELCAAYSFSFVRNPWDRVRSAFQDKIVASHRDAYRNLTGLDHLGEGAHRDRLAAFAPFVRSVAENPVSNIHWAPFRARCRTDSFDYSFIGKLEEDFDEALLSVFQASGLGNGVRRGIFLANATASGPAVLANATAGAALDADLRSAASFLAGRDARRPVEVPHYQDSRYSSGLAERREAYLQAPGLASPRELVDLVYATYTSDVEQFGYSFDA